MTALHAVFPGPAQVAGAQLHWVADVAERQRVIGDRPEAALVSATLPLRANLTVLENISVVAEFRDGAAPAAALGLAWSLLETVELTRCADRRDPDLDNRDRFIAKLLRAIVGPPPIILIERPALMLPDIDYPPLLEATLRALEGRFGRCGIVDYAWNAPLYSSLASGI